MSMASMGKRAVALSKALGSLRTVVIVVVLHDLGLYEKSIWNNWTIDLNFLKIIPKSYFKFYEIRGSIEAITMSIR